MTEMDSKTSIEDTGDARNEESSQEQAENVEDLGRKSDKNYCQSCGLDIETRIRIKVNQCGYLSSFLLCIIG